MARAADGAWAILDAAGVAAPAPLALAPGEAVASWARDGRLVIYRTQGPCAVELYDPARDQREHVLTLEPPAGGDGIDFLFASGDLGVLAYTSVVLADELYLVEGLR